MTVTSASVVGKGAEIVLSNGTTDTKVPTSISIDPNKTDVWVGDISVNGKPLRDFDPEVSSGAFTFEVPEGVNFAPGEGTITLGDFQKWDGKKSIYKSNLPNTIDVTITYADGTTTVVQILKP